jgi:hypothetical protein
VKRAKKATQSAEDRIIPAATATDFMREDLRRDRREKRRTVSDGYEADQRDDLASGPVKNGLDRDGVDVRVEARMVEPTGPIACQRKADDHASARKLDRAQTPYLRHNTR